jgi:hypothetical protein
MPSRPHLLEDSLTLLSAVNETTDDRSVSSPVIHMRRRRSLDSRSCTSELLMRPTVGYHRAETTSTRRRFIPFPTEYVSAIEFLSPHSEVTLGRPFLARLRLLYRVRVFSVLAFCPTWPASTQSTPAAGCRTRLSRTLRPDTAGRRATTSHSRPPTRECRMGLSHIIFADTETASRPSAHSVFPTPVRQLELYWIVTHRDRCASSDYLG